MIDLTDLKNLEWEKSNVIVVLGIRWEGGRVGQVLTPEKNK